MKIKKILYIISDDSFGGGSQCVLDLVENIDRKKFAPILVGKNNTIYEQLKNKCQNYVVEMRSARDRKSIIKIQAIIKKEKPNIIHLHATRAGILGTLAIKDLTIPIIYTEHLYTKDYQPKNKLIFWLQLKTFKKISPNITKVIAVSNAVKNFLVEKKVFLEKKIVVIYNGMKIDSSASVGMTQRMDSCLRRNDKMVIGSIGALEPIKGYRYLLEAMRKIKKEKPEIYNKISLEIIGDGSEKKNLQKLVEKLNIENNVKFLGSVDNIEKQMQNWGLYIQPSLSESFGLTLAKAMSMGIPSIATNAGGMTEIINSSCGILVPTKDSEKLSEAIIKLVEDKDLSLRLGNNAHERIIENFSLGKMIKKTEELYEKTSRDGAKC